MVKAIVWSPEAFADLKSICDYIGHDSPLIASRFTDKVLAAVGA